MTTPHPPRALSLAQLTALPFAPPQLVQLSARLGVSHCGIRLLPALPGGTHYPLHEDALQRRETRAVLAATGVALFDLEIIRISPAFDATAYEAFFAAGQELKARAVLVAGDEPDEARLAAHFAALCEAAAPYGLTCDLEFMPWTRVPDIRAATRIVRAAAQPNAGVLVDAIHFARSGSTLEDLRALPRSWLHYAQVCDATVPAPTTSEGLIHDARCARLLPGEGGIDLAALLGALPAELPLSIEIPHDVRAAAMGHPAWAEAAVAATRRLLGEARA